MILEGIVICIIPNNREIQCPSHVLSHLYLFLPYLFVFILSLSQLINSLHSSLHLRIYLFVVYFIFIIFGDDAHYQDNFHNKVCFTLLVQIFLLFVRYEFFSLVYVLFMFLHTHTHIYICEVLVECFCKFMFSNTIVLCSFLLSNIFVFLSYQFGGMITLLKEF